MLKYLDKKIDLKKTGAFLLSFLILMIVGFSLVSGQDNSGGTGNGGNSGGTNNGPSEIKVKLGNPFGEGTTIFSLLRDIVDNILMPIGGVLAVMGFIWSGFLYVLARGNPAEIGKAHTAFRYTAIGTIILFGSRAIAQVIANTIQQLR